MRIFFFKKAFFFLFFFTLFGLTCQAQIVTKTFVGIGSSWNTAANWSPAGVPTINDALIIPAGKVIIVDVAIANCYSIDFTTGGVLSSLTIDGTNTLNVVQNINIQDGDSNSLAVNDGTLNVGGDVLIYGNGNKHGELTVASGHVNVVGNFGFTFGGNGNDGKKIVAITNGGSIVIGGIFTNPSTGTIDPVTLANTYIKPSFRSLTNGNWNVSSNWQILKDDGTYVTSPAIPTAIATKIEIQSGHKITLSTSTPAKNLIVNGILDCNSYFVTGPGPFSLNSGATLITSDANGIVAAGASGSIQVDGTRSFSSDANYTYSGSVNQCTGTGLPSTLNGILTIDKTTPSLTVTICNAVLATKLVNVNKGNLISNGTLTLQSTASSYAQIGRLDYPNAKVSGAVNVQSFFTGSPSSLVNRGTRMTSSPVSEDGSEKVYQQLKRMMFITGPGGTSNGFDPGGFGQPYAVTLTTYSEPASALNSFVPVPSITTPTIPGQATFLFYRGNKTTNAYNKVNAPYAFPENVIANYNGTINQGPVSVNISKTTTDLTDTNNGINAVGNPYPAAIDWALVYADNNLIAANKVEDEIRLNKAGGGFVTRNSIGVVPTAYASTAQYIQPGQGFYIRKTNSGSGSFLFSENQKSVTTAAAKLLSNPISHLLATHLLDGEHISDHSQKDRLLRINVQQNDLLDETLIAFKDGFSANFDHDDAIYFAGNSVLIGSMTIDGKVTAINAMPNIKEIQELKLYVNASASGVCNLNFTDLSAGEDYQIFLRDALSPDSLINLKIQSSYKFNIDKMNVATYGTNRFSVIFKPELVEPPIVFTAQKVKANVELNWLSQVAKKISYFEVEVSSDKVTYRNIGQVKNGGTNLSVQYSFVDKSPARGVMFYRLKQFNLNGTITYTIPQMIDFSVLSAITDFGISVYPNPARNIIQVQLNQKQVGGINASIYDIQGKRMMKASFSATDYLSLEVSQLSKGVYIIELSDENQKVIGHSKFITGL